MSNLSSEEATGKIQGENGDNCFRISDRLIHAADQALIKVKQSGKDQIRVADLAVS